MAYVRMYKAGLEEEVWGENKALRQEIKQNCFRSDYKKHKILLIGRPGSGKSSIVNTLLKMVVGKLTPRAYAATGAEQSVTKELKCYPNCASRIEDFEQTYEEETTLSPVWKKMPDLFDVSGLPNTNDEKLKEMLRLLLGGHIRVDTNLLTLMEAQSSTSQKKGVGYLSELFPEPHKENRPTMVVFVSSCTSPIPTELIKCVKEVLEEVDENTFYNKYNADLFLLITNYDKVIKPNTDTEWELSGRRHDTDTSSDLVKDVITLSDFSEVEGHLKSALGIQGNKNCCIPWVSYNETVENDCPFIDNIALKLIKRLTTPLHATDIPHPESSEEDKIRKDQADKKYKNKQDSSSCLWFFLLGFALLAVFLALLAEGPRR